MSTQFPGCPIIDERGGYTVQPVPGPASMQADTTIKNILPGSSQKLKLLSRGNLISATNSIIGSIQLPNPLIATGITIKKIIKIAWAVTTTL